LSEEENKIEIKMVHGLDPEKRYIFEMSKDGISRRMVILNCAAFRNVMKSAGIRGIVLPEGDLKSIRGEMNE